MVRKGEDRAGDADRTQGTGPERVTTGGHGATGARQRAEERVARRRRDGAASGQDLKQLLHELEVHQVELELQNEELKAARDEIEAALRRYAELFEFAPIAYFQLSGDARIGEVNFAAARLLGRPRSELVGRVFGACVLEPDRAAFERFLAAVLTQPEEDARSAAGEFHLSTPPRVVVARITAGRLRGGGLSALLAVEDVTDRRHVEETLKEEAQRREEFLAALSHELRNPLAPIRNSIFLLQRASADPERSRKALAVIDRQVTHLTRIVDDLLDLTRIARGKIRLQRAPIALADQVRRSLEDHRPLFEEAGIELALDASATPCWVDGDASRIAQVLGNLLANALKFTNRGGRVDVILREERETAVLRVRDTGVGVPPEIVHRLFEPFSQAPQTLARTRGGLGLGLATVKGLVELHGGAVEVASEGPGRGAEFVVRLPAGAEPCRQGPDAEVRLGPPHRVLVIDDNEDAATSLRDVLEVSGHAVRVALDGPSGIAAARAFAPEVIICDIGLPGMDGYEVARQLRSDPALQGAWLVAMSGYAAPEDRERARVAGFDRHVAKPPSLAILETLFAELSPTGAP